ncbi:MAG: hypothetical protein CMJ73_07675 [Planctomycetaceae bacterium]|nr:hypothetical protein [Planctomycetaceae bacterium]
MNLEQQLRERLGQGLPGHAAQRSAAPQLTYGRHRGPPLVGMRSAAVLVLVCASDEGWQVPMIVRPETMTQHAGQTCFPGGAQEDDESLEQCALREAMEEIAVDPESVSIIGRMTTVNVFASKFIVTPLLASASAWPSLTANPAEVKRVIRVSLSEVRRPENWGNHLIQRGGLSFSTPHVTAEGEKVWGASCMILAELIALVDGLDCSAVG